ncbi:MAG: twin-arginine translocase subunit TatC [Gaiellaceae bacterium]
MAVRALPRRLRHGEEATLVEHLGELRSRIVISLVSLTVSFGVAFAFHERLIHWLAAPLPEERQRLITIGVTEPFLTAIKLSLYAALAFSLPIILWQLWSFLAPAMEERAQRVVAVAVAAATALFAAGLAFAYWIALPRAVHFLTNYDSHLYEVQIRASYYYSFAALVLIGIAMCFELPVFILALVRLGILTPAKLRRNRRMGYVLVVALAVILPTVDPVSLMLEAIPLLLLFEGSIWLSVFFDKRWHPAGEDAEEG